MYPGKGVGHSLPQLKPCRRGSPGHHSTGVINWVDNASSHFPRWKTLGSREPKLVKPRLTRSGVVGGGHQHPKRESLPVYPAEAPERFVMLRSTRKLWGDVQLINQICISYWLQAYPHRRWAARQNPPFSVGHRAFSMRSRSEPGCQASKRRSLGSTRCVKDQVSWGNPAASQIQ